MPSSSAGSSWSCGHERIVIRDNYVGMALVKNPLFARYFDRCGARNEERGNRELRRELLAGLSGRAMEVGAGTGLNFPHYPVSVRLSLIHI